MGVLDRFETPKPISWLLNWVNGWNDAPTVTTQLESAARLLLD